MAIVKNGQPVNGQRGITLINIKSHDFIISFKIFSQMMTSLTTTMVTMAMMVTTTTLTFGIGTLMTKYGKVLSSIHLK